MTKTTQKLLNDVKENGFVVFEVKHIRISDEPTNNKRLYKAMHELLEQKKVVVVEDCRHFGKMGISGGCGTYTDRYLVADADLATKPENAGRIICADSNFHWGIRKFIRKQLAEKKSA
jgi:hypothetical protein